MEPGGSAEEKTAQIDAPQQSERRGDASERACHTKSDTLNSIVFLIVPIRHRGRVVKAMDC